MPPISCSQYAWCITAGQALSLICCALYQDSVGHRAVQALSSLYGTSYRVGSICKIICEFTLHSFLTCDLHHFLSHS